jgi:hypothetical protein
MTHYIESIVGDEGQILIEVEDPSGRVGFGAQATEDEEKPGNAFNQALNVIQLAASSVLVTLETLDERPSTARIDFAIKFDSNARAMLAKSGSEAQLRVSLGWNTTPPETEEK